MSKTVVLDDCDMCSATMRYIGHQFPLWVNIEMRTVMLDDMKKTLPMASDMSRCTHPSTSKNREHTRPGNLKGSQVGRMGTCIRPHGRTSLPVSIWGFMSADPMLTP